jgi:hypothetical protein
MTLVILVGGALRSGKDTLADHLVDKHDFVKLGMSDVLAEALYVLNPQIPLGTIDYDAQPYQSYIEAVGGYVEAKKNPEVRRLLQALGTEVGRELLGKNIWRDAVKDKILALTSAGKDVVVTGIRFPNEIELGYILANKYSTPAATVYVNRPAEQQAASGHASETSVEPEDFEYELNNTGSLERLYELTDKLLDVVKADYVG